MRTIAKNILQATSGIALAALLASSCNDFLDMTPTDSVSDKIIWQTTQNAEYGVNYIYSYILDMADANTGQCVAGMTDALTDQLKYGSYNYNALAYIPSEIAYGGSTLTANYVASYLGYWDTMYGAIRRTNQGLNYLDKYGEMSDADKTRLKAELRFMRAYFYFDLVKRYKEVIIYDEDLSAITANKALSTEQQGWDFIASDLKFAQENLPAKAVAGGRLDKGAAYAFATRAMLYAQRYDEVIAAAGKVAELGYSLDPSYANVFKGSSSEVILQYEFSYENGVTHNFDFYYTPGGDYTTREASGGGYGTPTQEMVESYEYADGSGFPDWTVWHTAEGTFENPPYELLEPRFQASILYNGAEWKGRTIQPYVGGDDGWCQWNVVKEPKGKTTTGYYLRKGVDETHDVIARSQSTQPLVILRYAEVLLNKAEACYRTGDAAGANAALRAIRERVDLPYTDKSGDNLWAAIRQERKVELAFEGFSYWDVRRWGVAPEQYPEGLSGYQLHGLKIEPAGASFSYTYVTVDDKVRNYPEKMDRFPLQDSELSSNTAVEQFPEWK